MGSDRVGFIGPDLTKEAFVYLTSNFISTSTLRQRHSSQTFYVGSREFDPERVGYVTTEPPSGTPSFVLDTRLSGNTNVGHEYGTSELNETKRLDLLEYLKSL